MSDVTVLEVRSPVARKRHYCGLCRRVIEPGEQYEAQHNVYDGSAYTHKTCAHCRAYASVIWADPDGWINDSGLDWVVAMDYEPRTLWGLRLKVGYLRQWRRPDGSLWPVPRLVHCWVFTPHTHFTGDVECSRSRRVLGVTYEDPSPVRPAARTNTRNDR